MTNALELVGWPEGLYDEQVRHRPYDIVVATATDAKYSWPAVLTLLSAGARSTASTLCLLFGDRLEADFITSAEDAFSRSGIPFKYVEADFTSFSSLPQRFHFTRAAYGRLCVPEVARRFAPLTLYLDADTLVMCDIAPLARLGLGTKHVAAAVRDRWRLTVSSPNGVIDWEERGFEPTAPFFNSGVLVIHNDSWIREDISSDVVTELSERPENATFADQGALNIVLHDQWVELPRSWNYQVAPTPAVRIGPIVVSRRSWFAPGSVRVLHYLAGVKPWDVHYPPGYPRSLYRQTWANSLSSAIPPADGYWQWARRRYAAPQTA